MNLDNLKFNQDGLIPVITQNYYTGKILMQAYANKEAIEETLKSGYATYFSRSRNALWKKGETSGNYQKIMDIKVDCDEDSIIYLVVEEGPACHTGEESCFYRNLNLEKDSKPVPFEILHKLYEKIQERKETMPEGSYVASLFKKGSDKIIQKVGEEAVETVIALKNKNKDEIVYETSDLLFHLLIALVDAGVKLSDIEEELLKRYK
ncbi:MAG TPA: bifunctional phosphoribosyl-AMP cyclohydrolase/phosphoribosyl-ATP diphosphatase HisIE [Sulfurihydrogenibium sp.]|uniref:bifunctional phosphoribosyl-AMP cyclohydrolase/phosphoribosyl-ATP diphosphatase HisIE n=1 Tax=Sulfurihydrogenibium sp. (strain YO3AOP1) TaxID=436114 RepID=UPI000172687F|nr:bifunctional phosphoribosyl-AMP cyclohydrolase/phosphoribosyl-ATP diphosphatase HisIE [Sulfurihydrogenibium sp. YO3AOP1]ACD66847.1 phosphoribosyl-ATP diphosphatase [Sulfurihydrogenibium sp. YO3AOP1]HBT98917.1 bifunctional phosphoribosyl-AMP cyclohydrolase/phosphoribosyl-ATP diphosphatase HisIE [Sulfurihydrogenibium sp.]